MPMGYDPLITLLSMLIAIISSAFALWLVCLEELPTGRLLAGALLMGGGIAAMHYTGMAAMQMMPIVYDYRWVALSVGVAIVASGAALWMAFNLRHQSPNVRLLRISAAVVMGAAIVGMHYIGMAAAQFPMDSHSMAAFSGVDNNWLALLVIVVTLAILAITGCFYS